MFNRVRAAAVAGYFYPDNPAELNAQVQALLSAALSQDLAKHTQAPKALITPHAGYVYSGAVAASAYACLQAVRDQIRRVVLIGPSHRLPLRGIASSGQQAFRTPLGDVRLDTACIAQLCEALPQVQIFDEAHVEEHSLEVQLPFLQLSLTDFSLVPVLVGQAKIESVSAVLEHLWGGPETLIIVSSDLSHYHDYATAQHLDKLTSQAIVALHAGDIEPEQACGRTPLAALLIVARAKGMQVQVLDVRNSGDTAGAREWVVGYGAYAFH